MNRQPVNHLDNFITGIDGINMQTGSGQLAGQLKIFTQWCKVSGQQDSNRAFVQREVTLAQRMLPVLIEIGAQNGLINLYPVSAGFSKG